MLVSRHPLLALDTLAPIRKRQEGATTRRPDSRRFWLRPRAHLSHKSSRRRRLVFHRLLTACRHHSRTCLQRRAVATGSPSVIWKMNYGSWLSVLSRICSGRRRHSRVDCNLSSKFLHVTARTMMMLSTLTRRLRCSQAQTLCEHFHIPETRRHRPDRALRTMLPLQVS